MHHGWKPKLGACPQAGGVHFQVWAPQASAVEVVWEQPGKAPPAAALERAEEGYFRGTVADARAGDLYRYRVDGAGPFPDPASRFQPQGVHGPSEIVDPRQFPWTDAGWPGLALADAIIYELHVGTFSPEGTFAGVTERLPQLVDLGVTAIELMPIADFPGRRNWGYDGVSLFAPARCYGRPDDLRRLVNQAHRLGLAVLLDVVYNHLGPDGNYLAAFSPHYFTKRRRTPWGDAINFDGPHSRPVREFFIENALYWLHEFHFDGLRLDATHTIYDDSPVYFLAELAQRVRAGVTDRPVLLIAEDHRNLAPMVRPAEQGGWGLDAVWADDFHHELRRFLAGDHEGYYRDYFGTLRDLATTIRQGWLYCGQYSKHLREKRGTDPAGLPPRSFVFCIQNHDQVGNRALGERLHHQIEPAAYRAASALLLCLPQTPLLFMGQEWACSTPFLFFTDHNPGLGPLVTEGRRREFRNFSVFRDEKARERIPDPQAESTFTASILKWDEAQRQPHACVRRLYQALIRLRKTEPALRAAGRDQYQVEAFGEETILLRRQATSGPAVLIVVRLRGGGAVDLRSHALAQASPGRNWDLLLTTEDPPFCPDPQRPTIEAHARGPILRFARPGALLWREST